MSMVPMQRRERVIDEEAPHNAARVLDLTGKPTSPTIFGTPSKKKHTMSCSSLAIVLATLLVLSWVTFVVHYLSTVNAYQNQSRRIEEIEAKTMREEPPAEKPTPGIMALSLSLAWPCRCV